jgi:hypothetical protein
MEEQQQWPPSSCPMRAAESASDATAEQIWRGIARHDGRGCCTMMSLPLHGRTGFSPRSTLCLFLLFGFWPRLAEDREYIWAWVGEGEGAMCVAPGPGSQQI